MRQAYTKFTKKLSKKVGLHRQSFLSCLLSCNKKDSLKMPQNMQIAPAVAYFCLLVVAARVTSNIPGLSSLLIAMITART